jgi:hypothetical protein
MGRIVCRVVACVPPWEVDPTCTTAVAVDNGTAEQNVACWTTAPPSPPCESPATNCQVIAMASSTDGAGYAILTSFGKLFAYGDFASGGDESTAELNQPIVGMAAAAGGYYFVAADGGIFTFGDAVFYGSMGGQTLNKPIVAMAATPTGKGYWFVGADGGIFTFGDAVFYGSAA